MITCIGLLYPGKQLVYFSIHQSLLDYGVGYSEHVGQEGFWNTIDGVVDVVYKNLIIVWALMADILTYVNRLHSNRRKKFSKLCQLYAIVTGFEFKGNTAINIILDTKCLQQKPLNFF